MAKLQTAVITILSLLVVRRTRNYNIFLLLVTLYHEVFCTLAVHHYLKNFKILKKKQLSNKRKNYFGNTLCVCTLVQRKTFQSRFWTVVLSLRNRANIQDLFPSSPTLTVNANAGKSSVNLNLEPSPFCFYSSSYMRLKTNKRNDALFI